MTTAPESVSPTDVSASTELTCHVNTVELVGELIAAPETRQLSGGDEVVSWRLVVRTESLGLRRGSKAASPLRSDSIDCVAGLGPIRRRALSYQPGDVIEVAGALRHRFWRGVGGLNSRYEVEVTSLRRRRRRDT